jgi:hypothetical protein
MRGWMISQSIENFKDSHQFKVLESDFKQLGITKTDDEKYYEDAEFRGIANLSTGFIETGAQRHLLKAYGRAIANFLHLNKKASRRKLTKNEGYALRMMNVSLLSFMFTIAMGILFGKIVEDDPDNWTANFFYALNTGVLSERVSQLSYGVGVSCLELIRSVFVASSLK